MTPYLLIGEGALLACWLQELDAICGSDGYGRINVVGSGGGRKMVGVSLGDDADRDILVVGVHSPHPARGISDTIANIRCVGIWKKNMQKEFSHKKNRM